MWYVSTRSAWGFKKLPSLNATDDVNKFCFNQSVLEVLKTNCCITGDGKRKQSKQGKKVIPVKHVINASESEENEENENVPCSSVSSSRKKMQQKRGAKKSESIWYR